MPQGLCPNCHTAGRHLLSLSIVAWVDYYRCNRCGHVWTQEKDRPDSPPIEVTIEPKA
jgi:uncharacterized Zn finger protein